MRLIEISPMALADFPGFDAAVAELREESELDAFSGDASYDIERYHQAWSAGMLFVVAVVDDGQLRGFGGVTCVVTPRRATPNVTVETIWAEDAQAGGLILKELTAYARARSTKLVITAPVGGRLDRALGKRHRPTHSVYAL